MVQFTVKHEQNIDCGGGYVKLFPSTLDQGDMHGESPYNIMFGKFRIYANVEFINSEENHHYFSNYASYSFLCFTIFKKFLLECGTFIFQDLIFADLEQRKSMLSSTTRDKIYWLRKISDARLALLYFFFMML